jgi:hypothetical protein
MGADEMHLGIRKGHLVDSWSPAKASN